MITNQGTAARDNAAGPWAVDGSASAEASEDHWSNSIEQVVASFSAACGNTRRGRHAFAAGVRAYIICNPKTPWGEAAKIVAHILTHSMNRTSDYRTVSHDGIDDLPASASRTRQQWELA